jgi:small neutral amino acid transporter SnatA (MarC family)
MEDPDTIEDAWAGLLNGTIFTLLGAAFPFFLLWYFTTHWRDVIAGSHAMTATEMVQGVVLTGLSVQLSRFGIRMVARHAAWLRQDGHN